MSSLYKLICKLAYYWHRLVCLCLVDFDLKSISGRKSGKGFFIYSGKSSKREVSSICISDVMHLSKPIEDVRVIAIIVHIFEPVIQPVNFTAFFLDTSPF